MELGDVTCLPEALVLNRQHDANIHYRFGRWETNLWRMLDKDVRPPAMGRRNPSPSPSARPHVHDAGRGLLASRRRPERDPLRRGHLTARWWLPAVGRWLTIPADTVGLVIGHCAVMALRRSSFWACRNRAHGNVPLSRTRTNRPTAGPTCSAWRTRASGPPMA
jgi:hypothetical protein